MAEILLSQRIAEQVHLLTLNRPDQLNAMTADLCRALHDELDRLAKDRACRAIILTGAGRGFCAGLDLRGYGQAPGNTGNDVARDHLANQEHMSRLIFKLRSTPQPIIAAVNGPAAGIGLALTLGADIRFAASSAVFRCAFVNIGVSNCDMATSWLLPRLIGASRAHELMLTARRVSAEEASRIGLVADVLDDDTVVDRALESARQIAQLAPWAIRLTKQGMWTALEIPSQHAVIEYEDRQQIMALHGQAPPEAVSAFLEKRPATFADWNHLPRNGCLERYGHNLESAAPSSASSYAAIRLREDAPDAATAVRTQSDRGRAEQQPRHRHRDWFAVAAVAPLR